jgi:glycosyltransferase involved in cell wall biosynthesis
MDLEVIVVDDGSTDNTSQILKPYIQSEKIRYFYQENAGPSVARNKGILEATGEFLAFLDADDVLLGDSLSKRVSFLQKYPRVNLVFADYYTRRKEGESINTVSMLKKNKFLENCGGLIDFNAEDSFIFNPKLYSRYLSFSPHPIWTGTVLVRKEIIKDAGLFDSELISHQDRVFWMAIMKRHIIGFIDAPLAVYNTYRSKLSKNETRYHLERIRTFIPLLKDKMIPHGLIRKLLGEDYFYLGYYYYQDNCFWIAKINFWQSVRYRPFRLRQWLYLFSPPRSWLVPLMANKNSNKK